jgi:hypothetical protein
MTDHVAADETPEAIPESRMRWLVETGQAHPLLPGFFPAPVQVDGVWWFSPLDATNHHYVRASAADARHYEQLALRHRIAHRYSPPQSRPGPAPDPAPGDQATL